MAADTWQQTHDGTPEGGQVPPFCQLQDKGKDGWVEVSEWEENADDMEKCRWKKEVTRL
jgi:hypothetical protein